MPPKRTIIVNDAAVLATITRTWQDELNWWLADEKRLEGEYRSSDRGYSHWNALCACRDIIAELRECGIHNDLETFAGKRLTASERIRYQQCVRRLEAGGKVVRDGNKIRPVMAPDQSEKSCRG